MNSFFFHVACLPGLVRSNIHSFIRSGQSEHWRTPRRQLLCGLQASYIESCFGSTTSFNCEMFKLQSRPCWNSNDYQWRTDRTDDSIGDSPLLTLPASPARILMTNKLLNVPCPLCLACVCVCACVHHLKARTGARCTVEPCANKHSIKEDYARKQTDLHGDARRLIQSVFDLYFSIWNGNEKVWVSTPNAERFHTLVPRECLEDAKNLVGISLAFHMFSCY